jgi:putative flavoprotein involved in K+ transport
MSDTSRRLKVVIIGGGQAGLAVGYFLLRAKIEFIILDEQDKPGGAWLHAWDSLQLFSPASYSSLPGWLFPQTKDKYPSREEVISYLTEYEKRYAHPVQRPVKVKDISDYGEYLSVSTDQGEFQADVVVSCTGTWKHPNIPDYPGRSDFKSVQLHSANYVNAEPFVKKRVLIVGGGNSGAQILSEVSKVADETTWVTEKEPVFLPDDVDGRVLFDVATKRYNAAKEGNTYETIPSLGDVVMIDSVKEARSRGVLKTVRSFSQITTHGVIWPDGREQNFDSIIWCTGFRPSLDHLQGIGVVEKNGRVEVSGTRSIKQPRLWLVGYGEWTGFGSATLIGCQRYARSTAAEIEKFVSSEMLE